MSGIYTYKKAAGNFKILTTNVSKRKQNSRKAKLLVMTQLGNSSSLHESRSINISEIVGK